MDVSPASKASVKDPVLGPKADRWFEETQNWVAADSLRSLLALALPDKKGCIESWLVALADPSVCISSIDDVRRLDAEDIASLPVPPLVKGVFRYVLKHEHRRLQEAQDVLEATKARARAFTAPLRDRNMQPPLAGSKYFQDLKSYRLVLTKEEIEAGVRITAHRIETWCKGERIVLVAILKGAFMFLSDLCRTLTRAKTGLVRRVDSTPKPSTALSEHPELAALNELIVGAMGCFIENNNVHISYWSIEERVGWHSNASFDPLRAQFTLPRLLACFSLFDHNFPRRTCALSGHNYAVWGAEAFVRRRLLDWQGADPLPALAGREPSLADGTWAGSAGNKAPPEASQRPASGQFLSLLEVMRHLHWSASFAPHVGDFLAWAWQTAGLELGVRISDADFAGKDARLEVRDRSEKAALLALAARLQEKPNFKEHIASCRHGLAWREYGLGPLEKFARKYTSWFAVDGEYICLAENQRPSTVPAPASLPAERPAEAATLDAVSPEDEVDELDGSGSEEGSDVAHEPLAAPPRATRWTYPALFKVSSGALPYHDACMQQALEAPVPLQPWPGLASRAATEREGSFAAALGLEVAALLEVQALSKEDIQAREGARQRVQSCLQDLGSASASVHLYLFGTSGSGLGRKTSDLDLLLDLDGQGNVDLRRSRIAEALQAASSALCEHGATDVEVISKARVPLLRGRLDGLRFDVSVGSRCGLWNTALLRRYATLDPHVLPLCVVIAAWSKARGINDSPNGLLSTYSVLLMVVGFLQADGVVPVVSISDISRGEPCVQPETLLEELPKKVFAPRVGELLIRFFSWAAGFRWDSWVLSVRCGAPLLRTLKPRAWQVHPLCVEDPFETHLNTCRRVNPRGQRLVLSTIRAAARAMQGGRGLSELLAGSGAQVAAPKPKRAAVPSPAAAEEARLPGPTAPSEPGELPAALGGVPLRP